MEHTFLCKEGLWVAKGRYINEEQRHILAEGETRITHLEGKWLNEGRLKLFGDTTLEFHNAYDIVPFKEGLDATEWSAANSALGPLLGKLVLIDDSILSAFYSVDGHYSGFECLIKIDDMTYNARGFLLKGDKKISSWNVELKKAE